MSIAACVDAAVADGHISRATADEVRRRYTELADDYAAAGRLSRHEAEVRAAHRLEADLQRDRNRRRRMRMIQASKTAELQDYVTQSVARVGDTAQVRKDAAAALFEFDPSRRFVPDNVTARFETHRGHAWALASDFIERFRSTRAGLSRDVSDLPNVIRALFGENAPANARAVADGLTEARRYLVDRFNAAGGDIRMRADWGWQQRHNTERIAAASKQEWLDFILPRLDPARMTDAAGEPVTERHLLRMLDGIYDELTSGHAAATAVDEMVSPITNRIAHRELVFRDADAWLQYDQRFGSGDTLSAIIGDIDRLARETAVIETLGPYPRATLANLQEGLPDGLSKSLGRLFHAVTGASAVPTNKFAAEASAFTRNIQTAAQLGSAIFISVSDFGTTAMTSRLNGLPFARVLREYIAATFGGGGAQARREAARLGYAWDVGISELTGAQKLMGEVTGFATSARIADTALRASGLSYHTDALRNGFRVAQTGYLTEQAGWPWQRLPADLRAGLNRYGITEADWQLYRSTPLFVDPETGASFIRPVDIHEEFLTVRGLPPGELEARSAAAAKFAAMIQTEAKRAVPLGTARSRAATTEAFGSPGSFLGETGRHGMMYRSWMAGVTSMTAGEFQALGTAGARARYAAEFAVTMTIAGMVSLQFSHIARGRDPLDMTDPATWATAMIRGGAFGPAAELLNLTDNTRFGGVSIGALLGPTARAGESALSLVRRLAEGEPLANETRRLVEGFIPGNSLWYARTAFERLIKDHLEAMADPEAPRRWRRAERRARREFDQGFWWRRGQSAPDRAPDFEGALP